MFQLNAQFLHFSYEKKNQLNRKMVNLNKKKKKIRIFTLNAKTNPIFQF